MSMYNTYPKVIKAHCVEDPLDRTELNHVCCVCHSSLNGKPLNPSLLTSHGYCDACLEEAQSTVRSTSNNQEDL